VTLAINGTWSTFANTLASRTAIPVEVNGEEIYNEYNYQDTYASKYKIYSALTALLSSDSERSTKRGRNLNLRFSPVLFWVFALTLSSCSKASNIGFEYGSIYSPSCTPAFQKTWHVGNIDYDWGLWGHNLGKALGTGLSEKAFAFDGKVRNHSQFCFSSDQLYQRLVDFILNAYGDGTQSPSRFVIMPTTTVSCANAPSVRQQETPRPRLPLPYPN
jgi:hypothetical protein